MAMDFFEQQDAARSQTRWLLLVFVLAVRAKEISHMFFASALPGTFFGLFPTHPQLEERIWALDPSFDGCFPEVEPIDASAKPSKELPQASRQRGSVKPIAGMAAATAAPLAATVDLQALMYHMGRPQPERLDYANEVIDAIPQTLRHVAREPYAAQAVIYSLLLTRSDEATRACQLELLRRSVEPALYVYTWQFLPLIESLPMTSRMPLVLLCTVALKQSSVEQYAKLRQVVNQLTHSDGRTDLFEYCLCSVLLHNLDRRFGLRKPSVVRYRTVNAVAEPASVVLSAVARTGQKLAEGTARAFQAGARHLSGYTALLPAAGCGPSELDAAMSELAAAIPKVKQAVVDSLAACIAYDGRVTVNEGELLRAVAAVLECPVPPVVAQAIPAEEAGNLACQDPAEEGRCLLAGR
jgi:hypothetical protein